MSEDLQARLAALEAENASLRQQTSVAQSKIEKPAEVSNISVKLPPFWPDRVSVWFAQAEAQFLLAGIKRDETMYCHVLSQMDHRMAGEIEDIVTNPPAQGKYQTLKDTLIRRLSSSEEQRVRRLLSDEELGDRKPSQFLRHLRSLAGATLSDDNILRQLWLRRLPQHVQGILAAQADLTLDRIADIADKIVEAQPAAANVYAATTSPLSNLLQKVEELSAQVAALASSSGRCRSRNRSSSRSRQSSRAATPDRASRLCWYHKKFGPKALKCISPCDWKAENPTSN